MGQNTIIIIIIIIHTVLFEFSNYCILSLALLVKINNSFLETLCENFVVIQLKYSKN